MAEIYVSTDVEADGPIPAPTRCSASARPLTGPTRLWSPRSPPTSKRCPRPRATRRRWTGGRPSPKPGPPAAKTRDPADAMPEYLAWLKALPGKPVFVAYPAAYDFMFVYWYLIRFAGESPFSHSALRHQDLRDGAARHGVPRLGQAEHAARLVRRPAAHARGAGRRDRPGGLFCNMLAENLKVER